MPIKPTLHPSHPSEPMDRRLWCAVLAKLTAPTDPAQGAAALVAMLPMLRDYPAGMFCEESAGAVAKTARIISDGVYAPITRIPTFGELEAALTRWWREGPGWRPAITYDLKALAAPSGRPPPTEAEKAAVADIVASFRAGLASSHIPQPPGRPRPGPKHLSPEQLLATLDIRAAAGDQACAARAKIMRHRLAAKPLDWSD